MRVDVVWPVVWGVCFVGGVFLGSTGSTSLALTRPMLRGRGQTAGVTAPRHINKALPSKRDVLVEHSGKKAVDTNKEDAKTVTVDAKKEDPTEDKKGEAAKTPSKIDPPAASKPDNVNANGDAAAAPPAGGARALASNSQHRDLNAVSPLNKLARIRDLNGGLWGPNDEEEAQIAQELAVLHETYIAGTQEPFDLTLYHEDYSFSYEHEYDSDDDMSFEFSYEQSYYYF